MNKFGCSNKMFWSTETEARTYHRRIRYKGINGQKAQIRYYKCRYANHWHATSMSKTEFKHKFGKIKKTSLYRNE